MAARDGILVAGYDDVHIPSNYVQSWEDHRTHAVAVDGCGQVLVAGYSRGPLRGRASAGGRDGFILRADLKTR